MTFLKTFVLAAITTTSALTTIYPTFQEITHLFPALYQANTHIRQIMMMPVNGDSGEKVCIFINHDMDISNIFHLNCENIVTDITQTCGIQIEDLQYVNSISINRNRANPLMFIVYANSNKSAKLFLFNQNHFLDISYDCGLDLNNISSASFNNSPNTQLIALEYYANTKRSIQLFQLNKCDTFLIAAVNISESVDLYRAKNIIFNNDPSKPLMLITYEDNSQKIPALIRLNSPDNTFLNLFSNLNPNQLDKLNPKRSLYQVLSRYPTKIDLMTIKNKHYLYITSTNNEKHFFSLDEQNRVEKITYACGVNSGRLEGISSINLECNDKDSKKLVSVTYDSQFSRLKFFHFCNGLFSNLPDEHEFHRLCMHKPRSVRVIQDEYGTLVMMVTFDNSEFRIFYDADMRNYDHTSEVPTEFGSFTIL